MSIEKALSTLEANEDVAIKRLIDWLSIPSVSTDPEYADSCAKAAAWASEFLAERGVRLVDRADGHARVAGSPGRAGPCAGR